AQFDRNENRAMMIPGGRAYVGCLHLMSPMVRVVENPNLSGVHAHRPMESTDIITRLSGMPQILIATILHISIFTVF
ncbi:MAG TPA: hypothetical protein VFL53_18020, partial [Pseudolabrys sp.]|nr:hypothetical protein [Pseudolabrys sp.]